MTENRSNIALLLALALSGTLNVLLAIRVRSLEKVPAPTPRIKVGSHLENITGLSPSGAPVTVRYADSQLPTVLLVLRPGCQWCDANMPNWRTLIQEKGQNYRFVAVSLTAVDFDKYLNTSKLVVPGVSPSLRQNPTLNSVTATPQTVVVEHDGTVRKVWMGAYDGKIKEDVETFFGVKLPVEVQPSI